MTRRKTRGLVVCTLFFLGLGAFLPQFSSHFLDCRYRQEVMRRTDPQVSFVLSQDSDFLRTLSLFDVQQTLIGLTEGERMTAGEAKAAASQIMRDLTARAADAPLEARPMLVTSQEAPALSGVFWRCIWVDAAGRQEVLWLDDQSGRMVALQRRWRQPLSDRALAEDGSQTFITVYEDRTMADAAREMAEFCERHFPADRVMLGLDAENGDDGDYTLTLLAGEGGQEEAYRVPLRLRGGWLYFNL